MCFFFICDYIKSAQNATENLVLRQYGAWLFANETFFKLFYPFI